MKKIIRLTESDLVRLVKRVVSEQTKPETNTTLKNIDLGKFLDGYSNKLSNVLKGKTFDVATKVGDKHIIPAIKFTGFADRNHTQDDQPLNTIKSFDFISSAIMVEPNGLPGYQKNRKVYVSFELIFDNTKFVKFGRIIMYNESFKNSVEILGWTPEDFGGVQILNLQGQTPAKYA